MGRCERAIEQRVWSYIYYSHTRTRPNIFLFCMYVCACVEVTNAYFTCIGVFLSLSYYNDHIRFVSTSKKFSLFSDENNE